MSQPRLLHISSMSPSPYATVLTAVKYVPLDSGAGQHAQGEAFARQSPLAAKRRRSVAAGGAGLVVAAVVLAAVIVIRTDWASTMAIRGGQDGEGGEGMAVNGGALSGDASGVVDALQDDVSSVVSELERHPVGSSGEGFHPDDDGDRDRLARDKFPPLFPKLNSKNFGGIYKQEPDDEYQERMSSWYSRATELKRKYPCFGESGRDDYRPGRRRCELSLKILQQVFPDIGLLTRSAVAVTQKLVVLPFMYIPNSQKNELALKAIFEGRGFSCETLEGGSLTRVTKCECEYIHLDRSPPDLVGSRAVCALARRDVTSRWLKLSFGNFASRIPIERFGDLNGNAVDESPVEDGEGSETSAGEDEEGTRDFLPENDDDRGDNDEDGENSKKNKSKKKKKKRGKSSEDLDEEDEGADDDDLPVVETPVEGDDEDGDEDDNNNSKKNKSKRKKKKKKKGDPGDDQDQATTFEEEEDDDTETTKNNAKRNGATRRRRALRPKDPDASATSSSPAPPPRLHVCVQHFLFGSFKSEVFESFLRHYAKYGASDVHFYTHSLILAEEIVKASSAFPLRGSPLYNTARGGFTVHVHDSPFPPYLNGDLRESHVERNKRIKHVGMHKAVVGSTLPALEAERNQQYFISSDCLYRAQADGAEWVLVLDLDEYVVPNKKKLETRSLVEVFESDRERRKLLWLDSVMMDKAVCADYASTSGDDAAVNDNNNKLDDASDMERKMIWGQLDTATYRGRRKGAMKISSVSPSDLVFDLDYRIHDCLTASCPKQSLVGHNSHVAHIHHYRGAFSDPCEEFVSPNTDRTPEWYKHPTDRDCGHYPLSAHTVEAVFVKP